MAGEKIWKFAPSRSGHKNPAGFGFPHELDASFAVNLLSEIWSPLAASVGTRLFRQLMLDSQNFLPCRRLHTEAFAGIVCIFVQDYCQINLKA